MEAGVVVVAVVTVAVVVVVVVRESINEVIYLKTDIRM